MKAEVVYIDTDPACNPGAVGGEPTLICTEYIIIRYNGNYYYALVTYTKRGAEVGILERVVRNIDEFAWDHGLEAIEPTSLNVYLENELNSIRFK